MANLKESPTEGAKSQILVTIRTHFAMDFNSKYYSKEKEMTWTAESRKRTHPSDQQ